MTTRGRPLQGIDLLDKEYTRKKIKEIIKVADYPDAIKRVNLSGDKLYTKSATAMLRKLGYKGATVKKHENGIAYITLGDRERPPPTMDFDSIADSLITEQFAQLDALKEQSLQGGGQEGKQEGKQEGQQEEKKQKPMKLKEKRAQAEKTKQSDATYQGIEDMYADMKAKEDNESESKRLRNRIDTSLRDVQDMYTKMKEISDRRDKVARDRFEQEELKKQKSSPSTVNLPKTINLPKGFLDVAVPKLKPPTSLDVAERKLREKAKQAKRTEPPIDKTISEQDFIDRGVFGEHSSGPTELGGINVEDYKSALPPSQPYSGVQGVWDPELEAIVFDSTKKDKGTEDKPKPPYYPREFLDYADRPETKGESPDEYKHDRPPKSAGFDEWEPDIRDEQRVRERDAMPFRFREDRDFSGGTSDLIHEIDEKYNNPYSITDAPDEKSSNSWLADLLTESGIPRMVHQFGSDLVDDGGIHDWLGGAGRAPTDLGMWDLLSGILQDDGGQDGDSAYRDVMGMDLDEEYSSVAAGLNQNPALRQIKATMRKRAQGFNVQAPRLSIDTKPYRTSTNSIRKGEKNAGRTGTRRNQVPLVRASNLNELRSITELMPGV